MDYETGINIYLFVMVLIITILLLSYILFSAADTYISNQYREMGNHPQYQPNYKNINRKCPDGCIRGKCIDFNPYNRNKCAFNFECRNCRDSTGQIYKELYDSETRYINKYYNKDISIDSINALNDVINKQNLYIFRLNKEIEKDNRI